MKMNKKYNIALLGLTALVLQACAATTPYPVARGEVCRYRAIALAQSYQALTGIPVGIAVGMKGSKFHAQACIMMKRPVSLVRYSDGAIGAGSWAAGFKPEAYYPLNDFIDKTLEADRSRYAVLKLVPPEYLR